MTQAFDIECSRNLDAQNFESFWFYSDHSAEIDFCFCSEEAKYGLKPKLMSLKDNSFSQDSRKKERK